VHVETRTAPKVTVTLGEGILASEKVHGWLAIVAIRLVADVCDVPYGRFVTCFTHIPLRHLARHIGDHMIVFRHHRAGSFA